MERLAAEKRGWCGWVVCVAVWMAWGSVEVVYAKSVPAKAILVCGKLADARNWLEASECYDKLSALIPENTDLDEQDRTQKGYLLSESSRCLEREAMREEKPVVAAFLREKALRHLEKILQRRWLPLIRGKRRTRVYAGRVVELRKSIRYTPLAISTASLDAKIQVSGYQFLANAKGQFNQELRPGDYKILVVFPNETAPRVRQVTLHPQMSLVLTFSQKPKLPALLLAGYIVGGVAVVGGGILLTLGVMRIQAGNTCYNKTNCNFVGGEISTEQITTKNHDNEAEYKSYQSVSTSYLISGIVIATVGVAALVTAGIVHAGLAKEDFAKKESLQPTSSAARSLLWSSEQTSLTTHPSMGNPLWKVREMPVGADSLGRGW